MLGKSNTDLFLGKGSTDLSRGYNTTEMITTLEWEQLDTRRIYESPLVHDL